MLQRHREFPWGPAADQQCQPPCSALRLVTNAQLRAVVTTLAAGQDRLCVSLQACVQTFILHL